MEGFSGFKTATTEELPDAVAVMDPCQVVRLAGNVLDEYRRRFEHLRGSALGFRNRTNYIAKSRLETGGFKPRLRPRP